MTARLSVVPEPVAEAVPSLVLPRFQLFGPLSIDSAEPPLNDMTIQVLALLLVHANECVSADAIGNELWGNEWPAAHKQTMHTYAYYIRNRVPSLRELLYSTAGGYRLKISSHEVDVLHFGWLLERVKAAFREELFVRAQQLLADAFNLARGPALNGVRCGSKLQPWVKKINAWVYRAKLYQFDIALKLGRPGEVVDEACDIWEGDRTNEEVFERLMVALYRCGQGRHVSELFQQLRCQLQDNYGQEPNPRLQQLLRRILNNDQQLMFVSEGPISFL